MTTINITTSGTINNYITNNHTNEPIDPISTKVCNKCFQIKQFTEFMKRKNSHDGYRNQCKTCCSSDNKKYVKQYKDKLNKQKKEYREQHKAEKADYDQKLREINKVKIVSYKQNYYKNNKDIILQHKKKYYQLQKDKINEHRREYIKNQRNINPIYRLIENNRARIRSALQSNNKTTNTINLLGCNREFFYQWIIWQLPYEMEDNEFKENYHIDHCRAIATFDLSNEENQFIAFGWQNTQSLLKSKNLRKGSKRDLWSEVLQELKVIIFLKQYIRSDNYNFDNMI